MATCSCAHAMSVSRSDSASSPSYTSPLKANSAGLLFFAVKRGDHAAYRSTLSEASAGDRSMSAATSSADGAQRGDQLGRLGHEARPCRTVDGRGCDVIEGFG